SQTRRKLEPARHVVPLESQTAFDHKAVHRRPAVLNVLGAGYNCFGGETIPRKTYVAGDGKILPQHQVIMPVCVQIESRPLAVQSQTQLVRAESMPCRKIHVRDPLLPVGTARQVHEVIAPFSEGEDLISLIALRRFARVAARSGEAKLGQSAARK